MATQTGYDQANVPTGTKNPDDRDEAMLVPNEQYDQSDDPPRYSPPSDQAPYGGRSAPGWYALHAGGPYRPPYPSPTVSGGGGQQQSVVVVNTPGRSVVVAPQPQQSFLAHKLLACFTCWFFCGLFGLIAFCLALAATSEAQSNNPSGARKLGRASVAMSAIGVIVAIIVVIVVVCLAKQCDGYWYWKCYDNKDPEATSSHSCQQRHPGAYVWDGTTCYYSG